MLKQVKTFLMAACTYLSGFVRIELLQIDKQNFVPGFYHLEPDFLRRRERFGLYKQL